MNQMKYDPEKRVLTLHYANGKFAEATAAARREFPEAINLICIPESLQHRRGFRIDNTSAEIC